MRSSLSIGGHPLHPLLVSVPIGLCVGALACDGLYVVSGYDQTWYHASLAAGVGAVVTALLAAVFGVGDYFTMAIHTEARGMATLHMLLNVTVVALFAVGAWLSLDDRATAADAFQPVLWLHVAGIGILLVSGWLGGEMVFRHHLATVPDPGQAEAERDAHLLRKGEVGRR